MPSVIQLVNDSLDLHGRALVLCRSGSVRRGVLARMKSEANGWIGVEVVSLEASVAQQTPNIVAPMGDDVVAGGVNDGALPAGHPWAATLLHRPKLRGELRQIVERARALQTIAGDLPQNLAQSLIGDLVSAGWGDNVIHLGWSRLLARINEQPKSVIACGFDPDPNFTHCGRVDAVARALLHAVPQQNYCSLADDGGWEPPSALAVDANRTIHVSDVSAEARIAAKHVGEALEKNPKARILVLCSHEDTAGRLSATLARNGITVAQRHSTSLSQHGLASVCRDLLPIFATNCAQSVLRKTIEKMLSSPMLVRSIPANDEGVQQYLGDLVIHLPPNDRCRVSLRHLSKMLNFARRSSATPAEWQTVITNWTAAMRTHALAPGNEEYVEANTRKVVSGLVAGKKLQLLIQHAGVGTFGALADLLTEYGVFDAQSNAAQAIRAELRRFGSRVMNHDDLAQILDATVDSGELSVGVTVMPYHEYDYRASDLVVLLDLHSKGITKPPMADAFLQDPNLLEAFGRPNPEQEVSERVLLLRAATARANDSIYVVSHRGGDGKAVVPPMELGLAGEVAVLDHGLRINELPENCSRATFAQGIEGHGQTWCDQQIDAEWVRSGQLMDGTDPVGQLVAKTSSLFNYMETDSRPGDIKQFLGKVGAALGRNAGEAQHGLPLNLVLSSSSIEQFTGCMYRGFAARILRLKEDKERTEDLDSDELGTALHAAIEAGIVDDGNGIFFVVPDGEEIQKRLEFVQRASAMFVQAVPAAAADGLAGMARNNLVARWNCHWKGFADSRILSHSQALEKRKDKIEEKVMGVTNKEKRLAIVSVFAPDANASAKVRIWKAILGALSNKNECPTLDALATDDFFNEVHHEREIGEVPAMAVDLAIFDGAQDAFIAALNNDPANNLFLDTVKKFINDWIVPPNPNGDHKVLATEAQFGFNEAVTLVLGDAGALSVRGKIDAIVQLPGGALEIIDFKSGTSSVDHDAALKSLLKPQLPLYALAVNARNPRVVQFSVLPADATVTAATIDRIKKPKDKAIRSEISLSIMDEGISLNQFPARLGAVLAPGVNNGDFALRPHPDSCPLLKERAYCDFQAVCRLRRLPEISDDQSDETIE